VVCNGNSFQGLRPIREQEDETQEKKSIPLMELTPWCRSVHDSGAQYYQQTIVTRLNKSLHQLRMEVRTQLNSRRKNTNVRNFLLVASCDFDVITITLAIAVTITLALAFTFTLALAVGFRG